MTRTEQLLRKETASQAAIATAKKALAQVRTAQRADAKKALAKRALMVGEMAGKAGLLVWPDDTLRQVFGVLAHLVDTPDPAGVLAALLADPVGSYAEGADVGTL